MQPQSSTVSYLRDATTNSSDKTFVVPGNELWKVNFSHLVLTTTADVGNRQMTFQIKNAAGDAVYDVTAGAVQAAGVTRHYAFMQGIFHETSFVANEIQIPIPQDCWLPAGFTLRVYDETAVAASADDMVLNVCIDRYKL